ncbi:MAG: hypothetical protein AAFY84_00850 [Pseudomonadota bacterium]
MILRRITQHVKDQNWTAVALDFFIVVFGILIAFQITNWSENREDRRAEQRYLAELARDLEADIAEMKAGQESSLSILGLSELILETTNPDYARPTFWSPIDADAVPNERFLPYPYAALAGRSFLVSSDSTYEELIQTGNIAVVSDRALVSDLISYYKNVRENAHDETTLARQDDAFEDYFRRNGIGLGDRATIEDVIALAEKDKAFHGLVKSGAFLALWQYRRLLSIEGEAADLLATANASRNNKP